jgi:hypothetical protein
MCQLGDRLRSRANDDLQPVPDRRLARHHPGRAPRIRDPDRPLHAATQLPGLSGRQLRRPPSRQRASRRAACGLLIRAIRYADDALQMPPDGHGDRSSCGGQGRQIPIGQRTQELCIRIALGAQTRVVLSVVRQQGALLALIGGVVGIGVAVGVTRGLSFFLFGVSPLGPLTFGAAAMALPAPDWWRGTSRHGARRGDPIVALRAGEDVEAPNDTGTLEARARL